MIKSRNTIILLGTLAGAILGAAATWAYTKAQSEGRFKKTSGAPGLKKQVTASDYLKVGMAVVAVTRQIIALFRVD